MDRIRRDPRVLGPVEYTVPSRRCPVDSTEYAATEYCVLSTVYYSALYGNVIRTAAGEESEI